MEKRSRREYTKEFSDPLSERIYSGLSVRLKLK